MPLHTHMLKYIKWVIKRSTLSDLYVITVCVLLIICALLVPFMGPLFGFLSFVAGVSFAAISTVCVACYKELMKSWGKFLAVEAAEADEITNRLAGKITRRY